MRLLDVTVVESSHPPGNVLPPKKGTLNFSTFVNQVKKKKISTGVMEADFTFGARPDFLQTLKGAINHTLFWQKAPHLKQIKHADCRTDFTIVIRNWCCCITFRRPSGADGGSWHNEGDISMVGNHPADSKQVTPATPD